MRNLSGIYNEIIQTISQADPRISSETFQNLFDDDFEKKNVLEALYDQRPNVESTRDYSVLKMTGIPWDTTISDIYEFFEPIKVVNGHQAPHFTECVHFVKAPSPKKSEFQVFIEFPTKEKAVEAFVLKSNKPLILSKLVTDLDCRARLFYSSQIELEKSLFPHKKVQKNRSDIEDGVIFLSREEILSLLTACRTVKHTTRNKLIHRPFQDLHRDHLFEMVKLSIDAANLNNWPNYLQKPKEMVTIKTRLLRAGLCVPLFTEKQKVILLNTAGMPCPKDLIVYTYTPDDGSENEFLKLSPRMHRRRLLSTDTVIEISPVYSPPEFSPTIAAFKNLKNRADQADQVISLLQKDVHDLTLKYQTTMFELDRVEEQCKNLKRELDNSEIVQKSLGNREDDVVLQEPSPGYDMIRSVSENPFDVSGLVGSSTPTFTSRRLNPFADDSSLTSRYLFDKDRDDSNTFTNQWCKFDNF
jgi:hypothetical protein